MNYENEEDSLSEKSNKGYINIFDKMLHTFVNSNASKTKSDALEDGHRHYKQIEQSVENVAAHWLKKNNVDSDGKSTEVSEENEEEMVEPDIQEEHFKVDDDYESEGNNGNNEFI